MTQTILAAPARTAVGPTSTRLIADTLACPECGSQATVEWRTHLDSTAGPVEHLKIRCPGGHRFFMPAD
ncbi:MAG TPA: hypothetical protein VGJ41_02445 [Nocardioides sp.]|jgi:hypothetical protein